MSRPAALESWYAVVKAADGSGIAELVAPGCVFHSPAVHAPQEGHALTVAYLRAATVVLGPSLAYVHEWTDESSAVLRFTASVGGRDVEGVDLIHWDADELIDDFTVMVRPLRGLEAVIAAMGAELSAPR